MFFCKFWLLFLCVGYYIVRLVLGVDEFGKSGFVLAIVIKCFCYKNTQDAFYGNVLTIVG